VTRHTVTSPARLADQLARVRTDDYASPVEEMSLGACSVAVPVRHDDRVVASAASSCPRCAGTGPDSSPRCTWPPVGSSAAWAAARRPAVNVAHP